MRWILILLLSVGTAAAQPQPGPFGSAGITGGTIANTGLSGTTAISGTSSASRFPNSYDAVAYPPYQGLWLNPDKTVWMQNGLQTAGNAAWMPGILSGGIYYPFGQAKLPCDYGTALHCVGAAVMRSGYAGNLQHVIRASDGTGLAIGSVNGLLDVAARDKFCNLNLPDVCRIDIEYGQMGTDYNDTATVVPLTTTLAGGGSAALSGTINAAVTTMVVGANSTFPQSGNFKVLIGSEEVLVTAGAGTNTWTITRAQGGTAAASHTNGVQVYGMLSFAATTGVRGGMTVDVAGASFNSCRLYHVSVVTTDAVLTKTYDGEYNCTSGSGIGALFGNAARVNPQVDIGIVPAADFDYPVDGRHYVDGWAQADTQHADVSASVTFDSKDFSTLVLGRAYNAGTGASPLTFYSSGIGSNSVGFGSVSVYYTQAGFPAAGGASWTVGYVNKILPSVAPYLGWLNAAVNGSNSVMSGGFNEISFFGGGGTTTGGSVTLAGGCVGGWCGSSTQSNYNVRQSGNQAVGPRVLYSPALSAPQMAQAKASMIALAQVPVQQEDAQILIVDSWPTFSTPYWDLPLSRANPGFKITRSNVAPNTNCALQTNYATAVTGQIDANRSNRVLVIANNPNDYGVPSTDPTVQEACITAVVQAAVASGSFKAVLFLGYPLGGAAWGSQITYDNAVNTWAAANLASYGGTYVDLASNSLTNTYAAASAVSNTGFDFTQYAYNIMAPVIERAIRRALAPTTAY